MKNIRLNKLRQKINKIKNINLSKNKRSSQRINLSGVDDIRRLLSGGNVYDLSFKYSNPEAIRLFEDESATSAWVERGHSNMYGDYDENTYIITYFDLPELISRYKKESRDDDDDDSVDWWADVTDKYSVQNPEISRNRKRDIFNSLDKLLNFINSNFNGIKNVKHQE